MAETDARTEESAFHGRQSFTARHHDPGSGIKILLLFLVAGCTYILVLGIHFRVIG